MKRINYESQRRMDAFHYRRRMDAMFGVRKN